MRASAPQRRRAFTLLELLVVVAIISLLLAVLLPALDGARRRARQVVCVTHLREIGAAAVYYAGDNRDFIVRGTICLPSLSKIAPGCPGGAGNFGTALLLYLHRDSSKWTAIEQRRLWEESFPKMTRMHTVFGEVPQFQCTEPAVEEANLHYVSSALPLPFSQANFQSSVGHMIWQPDNSPAEGDPSVNHYEWASTLSYLGRTASPADTVFVSEAVPNLMTTLPASWRPVYSLYAVFLASHLPLAGAPRIANDQRHPAGINSLFFDGHVRTTRISKLDPGYPNSVGVRLRLFSPLAQEIADQ